MILNLELQLNQVPNLCKQVITVINHQHFQKLIKERYFFYYKQTIKADVDKIMENWGFKDQAVAKTLAFKMEKERARKMKKKILTPEERL